MKKSLQNCLNGDNFFTWGEIPKKYWRGGREFATL